MHLRHHELTRSGGAVPTVHACYLGLTRKSSWQPPHALPTAPMAALVSASLPPFATVTNFPTSVWRCSAACLNLAPFEKTSGNAPLFSLDVLASKPSHGNFASTSRYPALRDTTAASNGTRPAAIPPKGPKYLPCSVMAACRCFTTTSGFVCANALTASALLNAMTRPGTKNICFMDAFWVVR